MKRLKQIADFILKYWQLVGIIGVILGFVFNITFGLYKKIDNQLNNLNQIAVSNQQMTLKNTIWNDNIPMEDRTTACDLYLKKGYNSYTKKYCEKIIEKDVNEGIFSYAEER